MLKWSYCVKMNKDYLATHDLYSLATNQPFLLKEKKAYRLVMMSEYLEFLTV
jgi:hypothetical protein